MVLGVFRISPALTLSGSVDTLSGSTEQREAADRGSGAPALGAVTPEMGS